MDLETEKLRLTNQFCWRKRWKGQTLLECRILAHLSFDIYYNFSTKSLTNWPHDHSIFVTIFDSSMLFVCFICTYHLKLILWNIFVNLTLQFNSKFSIHKFNAAIQYCFHNYLFPAHYEHIPIFHYVSSSDD